MRSRAMRSSSSRAEKRLGLTSPPTGIFPVGFFNQSRIETAARLLLETDLKIYEVAERMGFSGTAYFCTEFKGQGGL